MPDWRGHHLVRHPAGPGGRVGPSGRAPGPRPRRGGRRTRWPSTRTASTWSPRTRSTGSGPTGSGTPTVTWRAAYDRGSGQKSGQLEPGQRHRADRAARRPGRDHRQRRPAHARAGLRHPHRRPGLPSRRSSATTRARRRARWSSVGGGCGRENNHGYNGPLSTVLGPHDRRGGGPRAGSTSATAGLLARVDLRPGRPVVGADGLAGQRAASTPRPSGTAGGAPNAWYLTALDVRTGRTVFSVRTGLGALLRQPPRRGDAAQDGRRTSRPLGGLVRVRDRTEAAPRVRGSGSRSSPR